MGLEAWGLIVAIVGTVAAVGATGLEVQGRFRRSRRPPEPALRLPVREEHYDIFISYVEEDGETAELLASQLRAEGLRVFLARWVGPGLVEVLEKEEALLTSANGLLIFSRATMEDAATRDEYATLLQRVHSGGRLFIPVLVENVELPPFARIRRPVDLREPGSSRFNAHLAELVRAVRPRGDAS